MGDSQLARGQWAAAHETCATAQALATQLKMPHQHETTGGLARVALAQGKFIAALEHVHRVIDHEAATGGRHGAKNAVRVDVVYHLVLASVGDPRATDWSKRAHGQLQSTASRIDNPALRRGFLGNIPEHRAVTTAWAAAQDEGAAHAGLEPQPSSAA